MPLYDYECPACKHQKEVKHAMSEIGSFVVICENCGVQMKKQLSAPTLIGFDNVGRSVSKKEKGKNEKKEVSSKAVNTSKKDAA